MKFPEGEVLVSVEGILNNGVFAKTRNEAGGYKAYIFSNVNDDEECMSCDVNSLNDELEIIKAYVEAFHEEWEDGDEEIMTCTPLHQTTVQGATLTLGDVWKFSRNGTDMVTAWNTQNDDHVIFLSLDEFVDLFRGC